MVCDPNDVRYKNKEEGIDLCPDGFLASAGSGNIIFEKTPNLSDTFEINNSVKIVLIKYINQEQKYIQVSPKDFNDLLQGKNNDYYKSRIYKIKIEQGNLVSLESVYEA